MGIKNFRGVFCKDELPKQIKKDECGVVNMDNSDGDGTHWVCYINKPKNKRVYYFDSFGISPPNEIKKYLFTSGKEIVYSDNDLQNIKSDACGWYCVDFIRELEKNNLSYYDFINHFPLPNKPSFKNEIVI